MTGAQRRNVPVAFSAITTMTRIVAKALTGAAGAGTPSGTSVSMSKMIGITVTATNMMTVPATDGVRIRLNSDNHVEKMNWKSEDITTRVASIAGPPSASAATQTAMKAPEVPISRTYPAPNRPTRIA